MAAFNFPNSPSTNDVHTENGVSWKWNGTVWKKIASPDTLEKANSKVQVVDAGTGGYITAETDGTQRLRIQNSGAIVTGVLTATSFNVGTAGTISSAGNITLDKPGAGIITATRFVGSGVSLTDVISGVGIRTAGGTVGWAATIIDFRRPGVTTAYYSSVTGVGTINFTGGGGGASVSIAENAPSSPGAGDLWWDSDVGNLQIYYTDATHHNG